MPVLIHVLDSEAPENSLMDADREAVEEAICAISMFSVDDISNKRDLLRPSVLETLEWAVVKCTLEARMNTASIVEKLANHRNSAREITTREGIIDGLLKLFDEGTCTKCWKNVITRRYVPDSLPTLLEFVQVKILSVNLTRRKSQAKLLGR